ncbi:MAG: hypothetical protein ACFFD4_15475, partial [Candidatus Odinarchaeota archaeon]
MQVVNRNETTVQESMDQATNWKEPESWTKKPLEEIFSLEKDEIEALQLKWVKERLDHLTSRISALKTLVEKQGNGDINGLNELAPYLFTHKVYKSYPLNLVEKKKFDLLTNWMDRMTSHDLSGIDMKDIKTIDDWLARLDENGMFIFHTTGTTGKLSFLPRSVTEKPVWIDAFYKYIEALTGDSEIRTTKMPVFFPAYRTGRHVGARVLGYFGPELAGSEEEYHSLFDYPMSADFMSLAGRLRAAQARGDLSKLDMIKALVKSKGELIKMKKKMPLMTKEFFTKMVEQYRGRRVFVMAPTTDLLKVAIQGQADGVNQVFAPDSVLLTGGGLKGFEAPDNWQQLMKDFYGVERLYVGYGMTECISFNPTCKNGHYHFFPWNVPFVLAEDGTALPREGIQTGRMGLFDLLAETYWGGLLTGDKVTIHYNDCGCGWKGPWIEDNIVRYSDLSGDDDKISCSGSQEAYNQFLDLIIEDI